MGNWTKRNIDPRPRNNKDVKTIIKYVTIGTPGTSDGRDGNDGTPSLSITLSNNQGFFDGVAGHAIGGQNETVDVLAYNGTKQMDTSVGELTGLPTGMTADVSLNGVIGTTITFHVSDEMTSAAGYVNVPVYINLYDPRDASGGQTEDYWDSESYDLTLMNITYHYKVLGNSELTIYALDLSNEFATVNCDSSGNILPTAYMPTCNMELTCGGEVLTDASFGLTTTPALTDPTAIIQDGSTFTFDATKLGWEGMNVTVLVSAYLNGEVKDTAKMEILKNVPGTGEKGADAVSYWLNIDATKIQVDPNDGSTYNPSSITVKAYKQIGGNPFSLATDASIYYGYNTTTPSTNYFNNQGTVSTIDISKKYIYFLLKVNNAIWDQELVPILWEGRDGIDGQDGSTGQPGEDALYVHLNNQIDGVNCDASGNIYPSAIQRLESKATYYKGGIALTGGVNWTVEGNQYVSIDSNGNLSFSQNFNFPGDAVSLIVTGTYLGLARTAVMNITKNYPGPKGDPGNDGSTGPRGISITGVAEMYAVSTNTTQPDISTFTNVIPSDYSINKPYLWNYEAIYYSSGEPTTTMPSIIGVYGQNGKGIKTITEFYALSSNTSPEPADSSFSTTMKVPTGVEPYLWNFERITYTDDSSSRTNKVIIGVHGRDGEGSYKLDLTNENAIVNCDASGNIVTKPTCTAKLYYGTEVMSGTTYSISYPSGTSGVSINASSGVLTFANGWTFSGEGLEILVTAKVNNENIASAVMTIVKNHPAADGADAVRYYLVPTVDAVHVKDSSVNPATIKVSAYKQVGGQNPVKLAAGNNEVKVYQGPDTPTPSVIYTLDSSVTMDKNHSYWTFNMVPYLGQISSAPYDRETIPILKDGVDGAPGKDGEDGKDGKDGVGSYTLNLTNDNTSVIVDASGNIPTTSVRPTCTANLYYGDASVNAYYYLTANFSYTGISINSSSGVLTFSSSSTFQFNGSVLELTIHVKENSSATKDISKAVMTITKIYPAKDGTDGADAVVYWITPSANTVHVKDGTVTPSSITVNVSKQVGANAPTTATSSDGTLYYRTNGGSWASMTIGSSRTIYSNYEYIDFKFAKNSTANPYDLETVPVLRDGVDGLNGKDGSAGQDGISIIWKGELSSAPSNPQTNWCFRYIGTTSSSFVYGYVYIYNGSSWGIMNHDGSDGEDGAPGANGKSVFITYHDNSVDTTPSKPTGTGTSGGWHTNATAAANWMSQKVDVSAGAGTWSNPILISGRDGKDATTYYMILSNTEIHVDKNNHPEPGSITAYKYKIVGDGSIGVADDATVKWSYDSSFGQTYTIAHGGTTGTIDPTNHHNIAFTLYDPENNIKDNQTVVINFDGKDGSTGTQGRRGPGIRGPYEWSSAANARRWRDGVYKESYPEDGDYMDVIIYNGTYYYCSTAYTGTSTQTWSQVSGHWTAASENFDFVAANLLLANNAKINFLSNNELYLMNTNHEITGGAAGGNGVNFWAGGSVPGTAPFRVTNDGKLYAQDASITGTVYATDGEFSGTINAEVGKIGDFEIKNHQLQAAHNSRSISGAYVTHYMLDDGYVISATSDDPSYQKINTREVVYSPLDADRTFHYMMTETDGKGTWTANKPIALHIDSHTKNNYLHQKAWALWTEHGETAGLRPSTLCINSNTLGNGNLPNYGYILHLNPTTESAHTIIMHDTARTRDMYLPVPPEEADEFEFIVMNQCRVLTGGNGVIVDTSGTSQGTSVTLAANSVYKFVFTLDLTGFTSGAWIWYKIK